MLILAPMAGFTDQACRLIAREYGCDLVVSEMVSAKGLVYQNEKTWDLLQIDQRERPVSVQLFGSEPEVMAEAARIVERRVQPDMIDINMGCPTPKIVKNGDGAALMRDIVLARDVAAAVVDSVQVPVTVKCRLGWDEEHVNVIELAGLLEEVGVYWIAVHGRTRDQFYSGKADWHWIGRVREAVNIPVVANGDIDSPTKAAEAQAVTGCEHLMIGRGALGNPWIFQRIKEGSPPPSCADKIEMAVRHLALKVKLKGEGTAVREMRAMIGWYLKGIPGAAQVRGQLNTIDDFAGVRDVLHELKAKVLAPQI